MTELDVTGTIGDGPYGQELRLIRHFPDDIETVWAAMTESEQLERWIGRWEGEPRTGRVTFFMTAEGDAPPSEYRITECTPPTRFAGSTAVGPQTWQLRFELSFADGVTTLLFAQATEDIDLGSVGPGWEYYLDLLVASRDGTPQPSFDEYYPAQKAYFEQQAHSAA